MNICVIDDEKIIANAFYDLIKMNFPSHNVLVFYKSNDLLEYINKNRIDILICDIDMPVINGIDLATQAKNIYPNLEIIFLTGMDTFDYIYKANKVKDSKYLLKIEEDETILKAIQESLDKISINNINDQKRFELRNKNVDLLHEINSSKFIDILLNDIDYDKGIFFDLHLNVLSFSSKEVKKDKIANLIINFLEIEQKNIFILEDNLFVILSSGSINEEKFYRFNEILKNEFNIISSIFTMENPIKDQKIFTLYSRMLNIIKISDVEKGYFYTYEKDINQDLNDDLKLIAQIKEYIYGHTDDDVSLKKIAQITHYNESYLSRLFKKLTGKNLKDYITEIRMEKAIHLLLETDMLVKDISKNLGFESTSHFQFFFKKNCGLTPQEFRREKAK